MGLRAGVAAVLISAATSATAFQVEREYDFWSFLKSGTVITPCVEDSVESKAAGKALDVLNGKIEAASFSSPLQPLILDFHALLKSQCFRIAVEDGDPPKFSHILSLKDWWEDGGRSWLAGYLREHRYGRSTDLKRITVFPGDPRSVLLPFRAADPFLKGLMCPPEQECPGVKGWRERAEAAFTQRTPPASWSDEPTTELWRACETHAKSRGAEGAYQAYRTCLRGGLDFEAYKKLRVDRWRTDRSVSSLPIGSFRPPDDGWLSVSGRRGHYDFCDGAALFDLKTGSAFKSDSCSGLVLRRGGSVDFGATDAKRRANSNRGTVSVDNLRELVWMLLMKSYVEERDPGRSFPISDSFVRRWSVVGDEGRVSGGSAFSSTAETRLDWKWMAPTGETRAQGELTWPPWFWSPDLAESHAAELLSVMEGSMQAGCPASRPSSEVESAAARALSRDDRLERLLESASEEGKEAMRAILKKLAETEEKREPIDLPAERESPSRRLSVLVKEPCASGTVK
jgi:hypothetical protein